MSRYVLDTSALITYIGKKKGLDIVELLIKQAINREIEIFVSVISFIEVYYIT